MAATSGRQQLDDVWIARVAAAYKAQPPTPAPPVPPTTGAAVVEEARSFFGESLAQAARKKENRT